MIKPRWRFVAALTVSALLVAALPACTQQATPHNVIIFVSDGLRHGAVDDTNMPTMAEVRRTGVDFVNSHSLFPTVTMPNASAIATGHYIGDTGEFHNSMYLGILPHNDGIWSLFHDMENVPVIPEANSHFDGNVIHERSLLALARDKGFNTAAVGKGGPAVYQEVTRHNPDVTADDVGTVIIDDVTGRTNNGRRSTAPLRRDIANRIANDPYFIKKYFDNKKPGGEPPTEPRGANNNVPTRVANNVQQQYMIDAFTRAILPTFADPAGNKKPFVAVYWSRDPDGTQHNAANDGKIVPGINSDITAKAFQNADANLKQLLDYLKATPDPNTPSKKLIETTNIFFTSDHGFGTISRRQIDRDNTPWETFAMKQRYGDNPPTSLSDGIFAIDLAHALDMPLFDTQTVDRAATTAATQAANSIPTTVFKKLRIESTADQRAERPTDGDGLIGGGTIRRDGTTDAVLLVQASGSFNLIHLPGKPDRERDRAIMMKVANAVATLPYMSGIWVDTDRLGDIPGALSMRDIGLAGASVTPRPAAIISARTFSTDPARPEMTGVLVSEGGNGQGYGSHGTFGRHDTYNCMMAIGPDFKKAFADTDPVSNADIAVTLGKLLGIDVSAAGKGQLHGRVISEAFVNGPAPRGSERLRKESAPAANGEKTILLHQRYKDGSGHEYFYFDAGGYAGRSVGLDK